MSPHVLHINVVCMRSVKPRLAVSEVYRRGDFKLEVEHVKVVRLAAKDALQVEVIFSLSGREHIVGLSRPNADRSNLSNNTHTEKRN